MTRPHEAGFPCWCGPARMMACPNPSCAGAPWGCPQCFCGKVVWDGKPEILIVVHVETP